MLLKAGNHYVLVDLIVRIHLPVEGDGKIVLTDGSHVELKPDEVNDTRTGLEAMMRRTSEETQESYLQIV